MRGFGKLVFGVFFAMSVSLFASATPAFAANVYWTGGGLDNYWDNGANWSTGSVPTADDDVFISGAAVAYINGQGNDGVPDTIRSLNLSQGASVTFKSGLASLNIKGNLALNDTSSVRIGEVPIPALGALYFRDAPATISGTGSIIFGNVAGNLLDYSSKVSTDKLTIAPGVKVSGGAGSLTVASPNSLVNQGTISESELQGSLTVNGGSNWINSGTLQVSNGSLSLAGSYWTNTGTIRVTGGELNLDGKFKMQEGILGGTFSRPGGAGTVNIARDGILDNAGRITTLNAVTGSWNFEGQILGGFIKAAPGSSLVVGQTGGRVTDLTIDASGGNPSPVDLQSHSPYSYLYVFGELTLANGAVVNVGNATGSTYGFVTGYDNTAAARLFSLRGSGRVVLGASRSNRLESSSLYTPGNMFIDPGVSVEGTGDFVAQSVDIINNGTISLTGMIAFRSAAGVRNKLVNNGTVNVAGTTSIGTLEVREGDFTQSSTGTLNVKIGTTTADQLLVPLDPYHPSGGANLAGRLNARLLGAAPPPASRFTVISSGARNGTFSATSLPPTFTVQYNPTSVVLAN